MPALLQATDRFTRLQLGPTAAGALQEFIDIDVTADDLVRLLRANRAYQELFARFVQTKVRYRAPGGASGEKEEKPLPTPTHRLIGLLGMMGSRNLIVSLRMHKAVHGRFPLGEDGKLDVKAGDYLKTALSFEDFFQRNRLDYSETAYAAGVLFDWIERMAKADDQHKKLEPYFQETVKRALRAGQVAYELARRVPGQLPKQSMPAAIVAHAGKLLLALADPEHYPERMKTIGEDPRLDATARLLLERENPGYGYEEVSAHALSYFTVFRFLSPVVRHARDPYVLKDLDHAHYQQASLQLVAGELARAWKIPANEQDPLFAQLPSFAVKAAGLKPAMITEAMRAALAHR